LSIEGAEGEGGFRMTDKERLREIKGIPYSKEQLMQANVKLLEQNNRYREALELAKHEVLEGYYPEWIVGNIDKALEGEE